MISLECGALTHSLTKLHNLSTVPSKRKITQNHKTSMQTPKKYMMQSNAPFYKAMQEYGITHNFAIMLFQAFFTSLLRKVYIMGFKSGVKMLYIRGISLALAEELVEMGLE